MSKHTPGPWHVTECLDFWVEHSAALKDADCEFRGVAHCGDIQWPNHQERQREWEANARLIAAAPDLLAALKGLLAIQWQHPETVLSSAACAAARAAIANAEGRQ